ncbi:TetR/AcrR family transcriptional regulator [Paracoccus seriniphilus]|uniref:Transcriptional regulator, TetR family n=1 Tax=Paracoccus seriniphilus TaxID=184748 RepID=A0A239Q2P8_9RHOB|nr:TetR/AcrR family transcriptional regulator [Paracoccus seriniphilus]WCR16197.1 TetR family transcriptional regulator [Paracoccus seriniphilus]SNT76536.1 transcriptional regulator, TetR family [Paracoccus seriniphilus]
MTLSLRERRRQQTARDIQFVTLELAVQHGLDHVTTEEIAAAAGISTRTFFNYFTNKESAAIGTPPGFLEEHKRALREGTGSLSEDLRQFLGEHMKVLAEHEAILKMIGAVLRTNEKARGILEGFLNQHRQELTECLYARVQDRQAAASLAGSITDAIGRTIYLWEHADDLTLAAAFDEIWKGMIKASQLLAFSSK